MNESIILASQSPRRKELLGRLVDGFSTFSPQVEELETSDQGPAYLAQTNAVIKSRCGSERFPENWVIGSDTVVAFEDSILGKPSDMNDAARMLKLLSGNRHQVYTAVCISNKNRAVESCFCVESNVRFFELDDLTISNYLKAHDPTQYAGAYPIQHVMGTLVAGFDGSYTNIVGLPLEALADAFKNLGIQAKPLIAS